MTAFRRVESERYAHGAWKFFMRSVLGSSETRTNVFSSRNMGEEIAGKRNYRSHRANSGQGAAYPVI